MIPAEKNLTKESFRTKTESHLEKKEEEKID